MSRSKISDGTSNRFSRVSYTIRVNEEDANVEATDGSPIAIGECDMSLVGMPIELGTVVDRDPGTRCGQIFRVETKYFLLSPRKPESRAGVVCQKCRFQINIANPSNLFSYLIFRNYNGESIFCAFGYGFLTWQNVKEH